jgi:hypothetical protein
MKQVYADPAPLTASMPCGPEVLAGITAQRYPELTWPQQNRGGKPRRAERPKPGPVCQCQVPASWAELERRSTGRRGPRRSLRAILWDSTGIPKRSGGRRRQQVRRSESSVACPLPVPGASAPFRRPPLRRRRPEPSHAPRGRLPRALPTPAPPRPAAMGSRSASDRPPSLPSSITTRPGPSFPASLLDLQLNLSRRPCLVSSRIRSPLPRAPLSAPCFWSGNLVCLGRLMLPFQLGEPAAGRQVVCVSLLDRLRFLRLGLGPLVSCVNHLLLIDSLRACHCLAARNRQRVKSSSMCVISGSPQPKWHKVRFYLAAHKTTTGRTFCCLLLHVSVLVYYSLLWISDSSNWEQMNLVNGFDF